MEIVTQTAECQNYPRLLCSLLGLEIQIVSTYLCSSGELRGWYGEIILGITCSTTSLFPPKPRSVFCKLGPFIPKTFAFLSIHMYLPCLSTGLGEGLQKSLLPLCWKGDVVRKAAPVANSCFSPHLAG